MNNNTSPVWKKRGTRQGLLRNALLKAILHRIEYAKGADGRIEIDLYPRLPKI